MAGAANPNAKGGQDGDTGFQPSLRSSRTPKIISAAGRGARDITTDFRKAAADLNTGQLVKDAYFTLFESVSALEIMDPKMDSGYLQPGEMLEEEYDVTREVLPTELLGIMDQMLCYEVW